MQNTAVSHPRSCRLVQRDLPGSSALRLISESFLMLKPNFRNTLAVLEEFHEKDLAEKMCDTMEEHLEDLLFQMERESRLAVTCHQDKPDLPCMLAPRPRTCQKLWSLGVRMLGINGGGCRVVMATQYLMELEELLHGCFLHKMFDIVSGTSAGGPVLILMFRHNRPASYCGKTADKVACCCFGVLSGHWRFLRALVRFLHLQAIYSETSLEDFLKFECGDGEQLFGYVEVSGAWIVVTAVSDKGYMLVRPEDIVKEPLSNVRRPDMPAGHFIDGGLAFLCPVQMAQWESSRIWPEVTRPDIGVSLGTSVFKSGTCKSSTPPGLVQVLWDNFMATLDGEKSWQDFEAGLIEAEKEDYICFNPRLN
ncbi:hypothetical protein CIRG_09899 [Coccidioides immitis RMSCC 2394]|uniref:PNPLA domain-containing protein n=1 Tax=Coccidioides immitis RMSCC 2394 TaxID=404692 RepID=A0A0J6YTA5_COCIT|nr:hypothetical protein CIRG_09899 [Coccidioides immitis RMSCC 2394]